MKNKWSFITIFLIISVLLSVEVNARLIDMEDVNKTMVAVEILFDSNDSDKLEYVSSKIFEKTKKNKELKKYIEKYSINLGYSEERCLKEFPIVNGRLIGYKLIVDFVRGAERKWYIGDAFLLNKGSRRINFPSQGFNPLAIEYNFSGLIDSIQNGTINNYSGLAPNGKLPVNFMKDYKLKKSEKANLLIKNIIIFDKSKIKDIIYIELEYFPGFYKNKRGWLIKNWGNMIEYYEKYENDSKYQFFKDAISMVGWENYLKGKKYDSKRKSPYFFSIVSIKDILSSISDQTVQITNIRTTDFKWDNNTFLLIVDVLSRLDLKTIVLKYGMENGRILIHFSNQIAQAYVEHNYFESEIDTHSLRLTPSRKAPFEFSDHSKILGFRIKTEDSTRHHIEIEIKFHPVNHLKLNNLKK